MPVPTATLESPRTPTARPGLTAVLDLLKANGDPEPVEHFGLDPKDGQRTANAAATLLMDLYRRSGSAEVFERLVSFTSPQLVQRVRSRVHFLGTSLDPQEVLQDTFVNIYRYPDRFDGSRPGAFRAWSSTIVDNTIRRHLRRARSGPQVHLRPIEILSNEPDVRSHDPGLRMQHTEACQHVFRAMNVLLCAYLEAYHSLSERERFVLQMVEVKGMRYAELAKVLAIRPEALKMVVFRARRRIFERLSLRFAGAGTGYAPARSA